MTKAKTVDRQSQKPLMNFIEYNTFQGFYKITSADKEQDLDRVFNKCILIITEWVKSRIELNNHYDKAEINFLYEYPEPDSLLAPGYDVFAEEDFHLKREKKQFDIAILAIKEFGEWTIRIREPNNQEEKGHLDWLFTTDVALKLEGGHVFLAVRTKCKESHSHGEKASPFRVKFLRDIFEDESLIISEGSILSHDYPMNLGRMAIERSGNARKDDYEFLKVVKDPGRQIPVIFCPAQRGEDNRKDRYRIRTLAWHLSGEAYVVTDEQKNGYKDLFKDRMADLLKQIGLTPNDALEKIKICYLYLNPASDSEKFKWFPMEPAIDYFDEPEETEELTDDCKKAIRGEIKFVEDHVADRLLARNDTDNPDIDYGVTLFYSELWSEYINNSDDTKRLEEALAAQKDAEQRLKELTESQEENVSAKVDEVLKEYTDQLEQGFDKKLQSEKARFEEQLRKKEDRISDLSANLDESGKKIAELGEELRQSYDYRVDNEKLIFLNDFWSKTYKRGDLTDWVAEYMSDYIIVHKDAVKAYKKSGYPMEDLMRNAFIFLYADEKNRAGTMSDKLYEAVHADDALSGFGKGGSGGDGEKHRIDGRDLDQHITYSEHNAEMFRIYYCRDKETGKALVGYIKKHL